MLEQGKIPSIEFSETTGKPLLPKGFSFKNVSAEVIKKYDKDFVNFEGKFYEYEVARVFCKTLNSSFSLKAYDNWPLIDASLRDIQNKILTPELIKDTMLYVKVNSDYIRNGYVIPEWNGDPIIWEYLKVIDGYSEQMYGRSYFKLKAKAYCGVLAGKIISLSISPGYVKWLLQQIGYQKYTSPKPANIVGTRMYARLGMTSRGNLQLYSPLANKAQKDYNKKLFELRTKGSARPCGLPRLPCTSCARGLDSCSLACRAIGRKEDNETT
jgi:hypothetical protein